MIETIIQETWSRVKDRLRSEVGDRLFEMWFARISLLGLNRGVFTLGVPNLFIREWIEEHYGASLKQMVSEEVGAAVRVALKVDPDLFREQRREIRRQDDSALAPHTDPLGKTFDGFLRYPCNELAVRSLHHVVEGRKPSLSPLFVFGPEGTGKTHLASAAAEAAPTGTRLYRVTGEDFVRRYAFHLKSRRLEQFRSEIASADLFVLDNAEELGNKEATQRELQGLLSELVARGSRIIIFANAHPAEISGLSPSMRSLFLSGMTAELKIQSPAEQVAILAAILRAAHRSVGKDVLATVVERGGGSVKRLDRLVRKIYAFAGLSGETVTPEFLDRHLHEIAGPVDPAARRRDLIFQAIEDHFGIDRESLLNKKKTQNLAMPRAMAVLLLREHMDLTFKEIGTLLGERSHTSVYLMYKKHGSLSLLDPTLAALAEDVGRRLVAVS